jgi:hypothetical protein
MLPLKPEHVLSVLQRLIPLENGMCFVMLEEVKFRATQFNNLVDGSHDWRHKWNVCSNLKSFEDKIKYFAWADSVGKINTPSVKLGRPTTHYEFATRLHSLEHSLCNVEQANTSQTVWKKNKSDSVDLWPLKVFSKKVKFINNRHYILRSNWKCSKWPMVLYSSPKYNGTGTSFFFAKSLGFLLVYLKALYKLYTFPRGHSYSKGKGEFVPVLN